VTESDICPFVRHLCGEYTRRSSRWRIVAIAATIATIVASCIHYIRIVATTDRSSWTCLIRVIDVAIADLQSVAATVSLCIQYVVYRQRVAATIAEARSSRVFTTLDYFEVRKLSWTLIRTNCKIWIPHILIKQKNWANACETRESS